MLLAVLIGIPISYSILLSAVGIMVYMENFNSQLIAANLLGGIQSYTLIAVPMFILAGELMNAGGISKRLINFAIALVGHKRGGIGYVAIIGAVIFAGLSGSAIADTAALGAILIPMMVRSGNDRNRSAGLIASGGIIANILPPSIPLILFGVVGGVSITQLFMAGIVPGVLMAVALAICWSWIMRKEKVEEKPKVSFKEILLLGKDTLWALFLPVLIIVGLRGGIFTPTEAGVVAVFYALFLGFVVYRELKLKSLFKVLISSAKITSSVVFLVAAAMVTGWLITVANIPQQLIQILDPFMNNQIMLMLVITLIVLIIGTVMDLVPNVMILTPILMPVITMAGIDPVYFGIVFILTNSIGLLTPPVGSILNVAAGVAKIDMYGVSKGVLPFLLAYLILLLLLIIFPQIITFPLNLLN